MYCLGRSVRPSCGAGGWHHSGTMKLCWSSVPMPASPLRLGGTWNTCEDTRVFCELQVKRASIKIGKETVFVGSLYNSVVACGDH